jgi:acetyl esterase/lipase
MYLSTIIGWVIGSRKSHQTIVNAVAEYIYLFSFVLYILLYSATKTIWISVEYRLGPEHKYPIWLDDASDVVQHITQNKTAYGLILF